MDTLKRMSFLMAVVMVATLTGHQVWAIANSDEALAVLGLQRGASTAQILAAARAKLKSVHPDGLAARGASQAEIRAGEEMFKRLNEARQFLLGSPLARTGQTAPAPARQSSTRASTEPIRVPSLGAFRGLRLFVATLAVDYANNEVARRQVIQNMFGDLSQRRPLVAAFSYDEFVSVFTGPQADRTAEHHVQFLDILVKEGVPGTLRFFSEILEVLSLVEDEASMPDARNAIALLRPLLREEAEKAIERHRHLAREYPEFLRTLAASNPDLSVVERTGLRVRSLFGACENFVRQAIRP